MDQLKCIRDLVCAHFRGRKNGGKKKTVLSSAQVFRGPSPTHAAVVRSAVSTHSTDEKLTTQIQIEMSMSPPAAVGRPAVQQY
mmetsp:Transcript_27817/g.40976  ORF Transcript_27817/g.40976 Transcript_27817/m.40976 type:complete len:83 (-) Transcript_27817:207-455(-)